MSGTLRETLQSLDVENVFLYVGDAVRWDSLPNEVASAGTVVKTVVASIHSPPSFASLATGRYPPTHGVFSFSNRIHPKVPTLFDIEGYQTRFLNSVREQSHDIDPIYSVLREEPPEVEDPFEDLASPFVVMERGPGGHAPYGEFDGTAWEYFRARSGASVDRIRSEYRTAVKNDAATFQRRLDNLTDEGLADDTLVVYTSDHGELLGEGGGLGHNEPMRPELVYVPTVFVHPDVESRTLSGHFRHVDLLPTLTSVLSTSLPGEPDGHSAVNGLSDDPGLTFYDSSFLPDAVPFLDGNLRFKGAWDADGGYTVADCGRADRLSVLLGKAARSAKREYLRRNFGQALRSYYAGNRRFGRPGFERSRGVEHIREVEEREVAGTEMELTDDAEDRLRDLGYL